MSAAAATKVITMQEVSKHIKEEDLWLVINGNVYDVSKFANEHPGGVDTMVAAAGIDGTSDFDGVGHSDSAKKQLITYQIGRVDKADLAAWGKSKSSGKQSSNSFVSVAIVLALLAIVAYLVLAP